MNKKENSKKIPIQEMGFFRTPIEAAKKSRGRATMGE
jgi:hypothetical protein